MSMRVCCCLHGLQNALRTQLKVNMLRIRERELTYYTNNCLAISTSSALLAGFAWYGLTEVPFDSNASAVTQTLYLVVTTLIMGLELLTVVNATLCAILGPGLALRGPDGSMHNAVQGMMTHYRFTLACFTLGLVCFMLSALLCNAALTPRASKSLHTLSRLLAALSSTPHRLPPCLLPPPRLAQTHGCSSTGRSRCR
jgi:hypothetical protein